MESFKLALSKSVPLFQLLVSLTLLETSKISIINSQINTQTIIIVKKFLKYFLISFPESSMLAFTVSVPISKCNFSFSKKGTSPQITHFKGLSTFSELKLQFKGLLWTLKVSTLVSVVKAAKFLMSYKLNRFSSNMVNFSWSCWF